MMHKLTRRRALQAGATLAALVAMPPLPALAAEPDDVTGYAAATLEPPASAPAASSTVDLAELTEAELDTVVTFASSAGSLLTDDEVAAVL